MGERRHPRWGGAPGLAAAVATAIEDAVEAKLRAEGRDPLARGDGEVRDRRRVLLDAAEGAVGQLDRGPGA